MGSERGDGCNRPLALWSHYGQISDLYIYLFVYQPPPSLGSVTTETFITQDHKAVRGVPAPEGRGPGSGAWPLLADRAAARLPGDASPSSGSEVTAPSARAPLFSTMRVPPPKEGSSCPPSPLKQLLSFLMSLI